MQCVWVILLFLPSTLSQKFVVVVPGAPVFSVPGSDVVLSCSVRELERPNIMNVVDLNVNWSRSDLNDSLVHLYGNHKDLNTDQNPSYRGRTAVFKEELKNGDASLKLSNIQISDEGEYRCRVDSTTWKSDKTIKLSVEELVPSNPGKTVGIFIGVLLLVGVLAGVFHFCKVKSYMKSDEDGRLQHHYLSPCMWCYVERTLLKSKEDLKEFNLRKYDPSDRGVEKLKNVIASSEKALLKQCKLTEKSCEVLASVLSSENSLTELDLSLNTLKDSGVKKLFEGLKSSHCKLQILRLKNCGLGEESFVVLAEVLESGNSKLIELNLSENFDLEVSGVEKLFDGLKNNNCKLEILRLENCYLTEKSCEYLASVLQSGNSKLKELNLNKNELQDSGVEKLCDGLKNKNCKLEKLRLAKCHIKKKGWAALASALIENPASPLKELDLSGNELEESEQKLLPKLKATFPDLNVKLAGCSNTDEGCAALASENPPLPSEEQDLRDNGLKESEQKLLSEPNDTFV